MNISPVLGLSFLSFLISLSIGVGLAHESWDSHSDNAPTGAATLPASSSTWIQLAQSTSESDDLLLDDDELLTDEDELLTDESDELLTDEAVSSDDDTLLSDEDELLTEDESLVADDDELLTDDDELLSDDGDAQTEDDDLLADDDELLTDEDETVVTDDQPAAEDGEPATDDVAGDAYEIHQAIFTEDRYPSANACAACHERQYTEWSVSQHAYAQLSPVYMAMQTTINMKTSGTNGDFCIRCHNQVGMNLGESVYISNLDRAPASREGITCVVCHRVPQSYGKASGRLALFEGDLFDPVYGPDGNAELERVLKKPEEYRVVTDREAAGRGIHTEAKRFFQIQTSAFCATCHDVTLLNGFRLEEAFAEYHQSPASANGVSCQDCHMGKVQGVNAGYDEGPAAVVGGVPTKVRKATNHYFAGPDYPIIHPGIFPHSTRAAEFKTLREWLQFDHEAGWGTDAFEDNASDSQVFPEAWASIDDRYDARDILNEQFERLEWARDKRLEVLRNGFGIGDIIVEEASADGIEFTVDVKNLTDGHGVPTGFDAERLIYLEITATDANGTVVYLSGDRDPNGDVRDTHSLYVHNGELPIDSDLFSLQSKFVVRLFRGGEREQVLAVNESMSVLPFVRPERRATTIYGRPLGARKHKQTIDPLGRRTAGYRIDEDELTGLGPYDIKIKLISQMVPVNLIAAIQGAGFDFGMSPKEIGDAVVAGAEVIAERHLRIDTEDGSATELQVSETQLR